MNLDDRFMLSDPDFHDGSLEGVLLRGTGLDLFCKHETGTAYRIRLELLERLMVRHFREGNIVDDVFVFRGNECPQELVSAAYGIANPVQETWFEDVLSRIRAEMWVLVYLHCSYGGEVVALARGDVQVIQHVLT